jgi:hypothetical protein
MISSRSFARLNALAGQAGVVMLTISYNINLTPLQPQPTQAHLAAFVASRALILAAAWLQAVGTVLCVVFALALVHLAEMASRFSGWLTFLGGMLLTVTSLVEVAFLFSATTGSQPTIALISLDLILAAHRLHFIIAVPALFFPLGYVITTSRILPRALGGAAIGLALVFASLGIADLFIALPVVDDIARSLELLWWFIAAVALLMRAGKLPDSATQAASE